jgi:hypothetical protein
MSRPSFLADHDLNEHIIDGVLRREPAAEFMRARDRGLADKPDSELLAFAADRGFLVVSHDVNTMTAHAYARLTSGDPMSGLLMVRQTEPIEFLDQGVHVLVIDLFPPTPHEPQGIHQAIWSEKYDGDFEFHPDKPFTLASYRATTEGSIARSSSRLASGMRLPRCRCSSGPVAISTWTLSKPIRTRGKSIPRR